MKNLTYKLAKSGHIVPKLGYFFNFQKRAGEASNSSYYDRDDESCKFRIHTLVTAYGILSDTELAINL